MYKLIRDRIPELIGEDAQYAAIGSDALYIETLFDKLFEEVGELAEARTAKNLKKELIYEMCDVLEVLDAIKSFYGLDDETIKFEKEQKARLKGKFEKRYIGFFEEYHGRD